MSAATRLLAKYERLAETAHRLGCYVCARKWSVKAEKLEVAIAVLEEIKEETEMKNSYKRIVNNGDVVFKAECQTRLFLEKISFNPDADFDFKDCGKLAGLLVLIALRSNKENKFNKCSDYQQVAMLVHDSKHIYDKVEALSSIDALLDDAKNSWMNDWINEWAAKIYPRKVSA